MLGETKWRPKTRSKNKLRLKMKRILRPKLRKDKIIVIEDSSSQEDMEEEENLSSQQVHTEKEHSVILESSSGKDKVLEQPTNFSIERGKFLEVPIEEE